MDTAYAIDDKARTNTAELRRRYAMIRCKFPSVEPEELATTDEGKLKLAYLWQTIKRFCYDRKEDKFYLNGKP